MSEANHKGTNMYLKTQIRAPRPVTTRDSGPISYFGSIRVSPAKNDIVTLSYMTSVLSFFFSKNKNTKNASARICYALKANDPSQIFKSAL
jgi:hypothetical protein